MPRSTGLIVMSIMIILAFFTFSYLKQQRIDAKVERSKKQNSLRTEYIIPYIENVRYVKDKRTGICYAIITRSCSIGDCTSVTDVPCEACQHLLENKQTVEVTDATE